MPPCAAADAGTLVYEITVNRGRHRTARVLGQDREAA